MVHIRPIRREDNAQLASIIRYTFIEFNVPTAGTVYEDPTTDELFTLFQTPGSVCFVAEVDNELAGCCGIFPTEGLENGYAELVKFYLEQRFRGQGIGRALTEQCMQAAKENGYTHLYLETMPGFKNAVAMYQKMEFESLDHPLGNSGHCGCSIWMQKKL